jgi:MATE family multidrug resistance protein
MSLVRHRLFADGRTIVRLGGPLLANNLSVMGMQFADTIMAGQLGARDLAGLAVGVSYFHLHMFVGLGLFMAVSPVVAHAYGANDLGQVARYVRQSIWLVIALAVLLTWGLWQARWVLPALQISPEILPVAIGYAEAMSFGMPGLLAFFALRFFNEGLGRTRPIMYIGFAALALNVLGNWVFMYGRWGMPRLGAVGCGVATAIADTSMFVAMLLHVLRHRVYRPFQLFSRIEAPDPAVLRELIRIGAPIAGSVLAEGGLFVVAALMMGAMGAVQTGAHQIALNYAAFMFMMPLAVSSATTIHVGHLLGRGDIQGGRAAGLLGVCICAAIMALSAGTILLFNDQIAAVYTQDAQVRDLAAALLLLAALFQVSDGLQVGAAGALRGFKDTAVPMLICVFGYWMVGFPLAYVLGVRQGRGPAYVWVGLTVGLTVCAVLLIARYLRVTRLRLLAKIGQDDGIRRMYRMNE